MTHEVMDKCLDFAEGCKGKFTIYASKRPGFPETLLMGTDKQREINEYVDRGYTTRQIADIMNCSQPTIVGHRQKYTIGKNFYFEWCEFWDVIADVRVIPTETAFGDILSESQLLKYQKKGIKTVGDYLNLSVTKTNYAMYQFLNENATTRRKLFARIREMCFEISP